VTARIAIIDGVTGAGKTTVIGLLASLFRDSPNRHDVIVIDEDMTLGAIMDQVRDPAWRAHPTFEAIESTIAQLEAAALSTTSVPRLILVERLHLTAYALFPDWRKLRGFDQRLARLNAVSVLLTYPPEDTETRSIERPDRAAQGWAQATDAWHGSRRNAVREIKISQQRRRRALDLSRLPFLVVDMRAQDWTCYVRTIAAFLERDG